MSISKSRSVSIAITVGSGYVIWGILESVSPSFYPTVAEKIGAQPHQYGFVYGILSLAALIFSPNFAKFGKQIGVKRLFLFGAFGQGISGICFGTVIFITNLEWFLTLSYLWQFVEGVCEVAAWSAILALLMDLFPNKILYIVAWTETAFGIGYMIGPVIGAFLYRVGGFGMPFFVVGGACIINAIFLLIVIPPPLEPEDQKDADESNCGKKLTIHGVITSPLIIIPMVDLGIANIGDPFMEAMIGPYMQEMLGSQELEISICFALCGVGFMVFSIICAWVIERLKYPTLVSLTGNVLFMVAYFFIGPVSRIPLNPNIYLIWTMATLNGIAFAFSSVSTFAVAQKSAVQLGYKDDISTYMVISGMWTMFYYLGMFVSPTFGGILVNAYGFRGTTWFIVGAYLFAAIMDIFYLIITKKSEYSISQEYIKIS